MEAETYNAWSVVNLVFRHLAAQGLHPVLGQPGDPGAPAAALLRALGITPSAEGNAKVAAGNQDRLAELRAAYELSQVESTRPRRTLCDPVHKHLPKEGCR